MSAEAVVGPGASSAAGPVHWYSFIYQAPGFLLGFVVGGITGYFGNWLWYRFGPHRNKPHLSVQQERDRISFSGVMDETNQTQVIKTLRAAYSREPTKKGRPVAMPLTTESVTSTGDTRPYGPGQS